MKSYNQRASTQKRKDWIRQQRPVNRPSAIGTNLHEQMSIYFGELPRYTVMVKLTDKSRAERLASNGHGNTTTRRANAVMFHDRNEADRAAVSLTGFLPNVERVWVATF